MKFNFISKNSTGIVISLTLIVLLSQTKIFNFLLNSVLGRSILVLFIIVIAYTNQFLGILIVLFIIILFNQSEIEGFTSDTSDTSGTAINNSGNIKPTLKTKKNNVKQKIETAKQNNTSTKKTNINKQENNNAANTIKNVLTTNGGAEGFDIIGTESNIMRGKQSNQVPINSYMRETNNILPHDGSFSNLFNAF
jgi:hypothetical protein